MVVLIKVGALHRELFDLIVEGDSLNKSFEVLTIIKGGLEKSQTFNDVGILAELNESLNSLLEKSALLKP